MQKLRCIAEEERLLITMPWGIGDAIVVGLSAIDQITRNDPQGNVAIDLLCNKSQIELLKEDPRIHRLIAVDKNLFPTNEAGTWKRGIFLSSDAAKLATFLRDQDYTAILPFMFAPTLFYRLHPPVMFLSVQEGWRVISRLRAFKDTSTQTLIRWIIHKHFGMKESAMVDAPIPLYLCPEHLQQARQEIMCIKQQTIISSEQCRLLVVAPDTSSQNASINLMCALAPVFPGRIFLMSAEPKHSLLELGAFIDQSDIFISGDTGVMHLAATKKIIKQSINEELLPRNTVEIITLFGGTNPALYGYNTRAIIVGRGRKEQAKIFPGVTKELYHPKGKNLFDHIPHQQLTDALLHCCE